MKVSVAKAEGPTLDWMVAKCVKLEVWAGETVDITRYTESDVPVAVYLCDDGEAYSPTTDWSQGGPIIDAMMKEGLTLLLGGPYSGNTRCWAKLEGRPGLYSGPTPLVAAMRCYVAPKLGDEVEVPTGLG